MPFKLWTRQSLAWAGAVSGGVAPIANKYTPDDAGSGIVFTNNDRTITGSLNSVQTAGTVKTLNAGKFFFEQLIVSLNTYCSIGFMNYQMSRSSALGVNGGSFGYRYDGALIYSGSTVATRTNLVASNLVGFYMDMDARTFIITVDGSQIAAFDTGFMPSDVIIPAATVWNGTSVKIPDTPTYPRSGYTYWPLT